MSPSQDQVVDLTGDETSPPKPRATPAAPEHHTTSSVTQKLAMLSEGLKTVTAERKILAEKNQTLTNELLQAKEGALLLETTLGMARGQVNAHLHKISELEEENKKLQVLENYETHYLRKQKEVCTLKEEKKQLKREQQRLMEAKDEQLNKLKEEQQRLMEAKDEQLNKLKEGHKKLLADLSSNSSQLFEGLNEPASANKTAVTPPPLTNPKRPLSSGATALNTGAIRPRMNDASAPPQRIVPVATTSKRVSAQAFSDKPVQRAAPEKKEGEIEPSKKKQRGVAFDTRPGIGRNR